MRREEIPQIIDGTHPTFGLGIYAAHQGLIVASGLAISLETIPNMPVMAHRFLYIFETAVLFVFAIEYITRIVCARHPLRYIFSFWGIVDFLSCLPILLVIQSQWTALRAMRLLRLVRLLKLLHSNRALMRLERALEASKGELVVFAFLAAIILYIAAVGIYIFEHEAQPEAFKSIPVSLWWAVVSFTTVGYGDIYPITWEGRLFTTCILFIGLGVIAVPTAIITRALINDDMRAQIEQEVEDELREELVKHLKKEAQARKAKSKRRE